MISLTLPRDNDDKNRVISMACDYTDEQLIETGLLPPASILTADTATLLIRRKGRPIGLLSTATGQNPDTTLRSEIHGIYLEPRWRRKGYAAAVLTEFTMAAPYPAFLRGPLPDQLSALAKALDIPTEDVNDICMLNMVTEAFRNTVICEHQMDTCRMCLSGELRHHFTAAYTAMAAQLEGDTGE
jgi:hypothetical protein